jgi:hypothetical protein
VSIAAKAEVSGKYVPEIKINNKGNKQPALACLSNEWIGRYVG